MRRLVSSLRAQTRFASVLAKHFKVAATGYRKGDPGDEACGVRCEKGNRLVATDRDAASNQFAKAIKALQTARQNTRFFPTEHFDEALHDTYYYLALAYHKLYLVSRKETLLNTANLAWREYFDFFPKKLEGNPAFEQNREAARKYWAQIKDQQS